MALNTWFLLPQRWLANKNSCWYHTALVYQSTTSERISNKSIHIVVIWVDIVGSDKWCHHFGRPHCLQLQTRSPKSCYLPHRRHIVNLREHSVSLHRRGISNVNNSNSTKFDYSTAREANYFVFGKHTHTHTKTQCLTQKTAIFTEDFLWLPST